MKYDTNQNMKNMWKYNRMSN